MPQLVILAGGKGTRLADRLRQADGSFLPKPLVQVEGVPLLARQIAHAAAYGMKRVTILVNHRADAIAEFCARHIADDITISLIDDGEPRGTAGAVLASLDALDDEFCVMYGDTLLNVDMTRFHAFHTRHGAGLTLLAHPNDHPQDSDLMETDSAGRVVAIHPYPHLEGAEYRNLVNAALYFVRKEALLPFVDAPYPLDFAKDLFPRMVAAGMPIAAYESPEYIKDVGTPTRLEAAEADIRSGRVAAQTLSKAQRAVFLDRDGVINEERGHISQSKDLVLIPGAAAAIRRLNKAGILVVVVTNQPVVARGECSEEGLRRIHNRLETLLGAQGAYIDRLYYCPHHPDKGFAGERADLKIHCQCRKPGIAMLETAMAELHIDPAFCWLVGDRTGDIQCARNAGLRSILVSTGAAGQDGKYAVSPDKNAADISEAVTLILQEQQTQERNS